MGEWMLGGRIPADAMANDREKNWKQWSRKEMIVRRMREEIMISKLRTMIKSTDDAEMIEQYMKEIALLERQRRKIISRENSSTSLEQDAR
jgi:hypothetical protein